MTLRTIVILNQAVTLAAVAVLIILKWRKDVG
jgi:hypothetical protein